MNDAGSVYVAQSEDTAPGLCLLTFPAVAIDASSSGRIRCVQNEDLERGTLQIRTSNMTVSLVNHGRNVQITR
jgi:hypothetical protein